MARKERGDVYLVHMSEPVAHARHYLGWAKCARDRLELHRSGRGARLLQVAVMRGARLALAAIWEGTRDDERRRKKRHNAPRMCPVCRGELTLEEAMARYPERPGATRDAIAERKRQARARRLGKGAA